MNHLHSYMRTQSYSKINRQINFIFAQLNINLIIINIKKNYLVQIIMIIIKSILETTTSTTTHINQLASQLTNLVQFNLVLSTYYLASKNVEFNFFFLLIFKFQFSFTCKFSSTFSIFTCAFAYILCINIIIIKLVFTFY